MLFQTLFSFLGLSLLGSSGVLLLLLEADIGQASEYSERVGLAIVSSIDCILLKLTLMCTAETGISCKLFLLHLFPFFEVCRFHLPVIFVTARFVLNILVGRYKK